MSNPDERAYEIRRFVQVLERYNQGDDLERIDHDLQRAVAACTDHVANFGGTAKASLTVALTMTADAKGVEISVVPTLKLPGRPVVKDRFFISERGDTLTLRNPNRGTMFEHVDLGRAPRG